MIADEAMFVVTLAFIVGSLYFGRRKQSSLVTMWALPLLWLAIYYGCLVIDLDPVHSDPQLRLALFRPGLAFLFVMVTIYLFNGHVNNSIRRVIAALRTLWNKTSSN